MDSNIDTLQEMLTEIKLIRQESFDLFRKHNDLEAKLSSLEDLTRKNGQDIKISIVKRFEYLRLKQLYMNRAYLSVAALLMIALINVFLKHSVYIHDSNASYAHDSLKNPILDVTSSSVVLLTSCFGIYSAIKSYKLDRNRD